MGSGKTTIVNHFKNLWTLDEWLEPSPEVISQPFDKLTPEEKADADNWVGTQFCKKNIRLLQEQEGIAIVDRSPLDPLTFEEGNLQARANTLRGQISPDKSNYRIEPGMVFALEAEAYELRVRLIRKWKFWSEETIQKLIQAIRTYYSHSAAYIDTKGLPVDEVVRTVSRQIFFRSIGRWISIDCWMQRFNLTSRKLPKDKSSLMFCFYVGSADFSRHPRLDRVQRLAQRPLLPPQVIVHLRREGVLYLD